jgi:c-di-GMP-binding flagellar brake protein YcgR
MGLNAAQISDRRAHDRHPFRTEVILNFADGRRVVGQTLDIGQGGAGVVCDINAVVGWTVRLRLRVPAQTTGSHLFEADAEVVNSILARRDGGFRLGLEFRPLSAAADAALKDYLAS